MMMQMLEAGGIPVLTDRERQPDADNLNGYYELEAVKRLPHESDWVAGASGSAVKVIYRLLESLPINRRYRVLFMRRSLDETLASQAAMLKRRGTTGATLDADELKPALQRDVQRVLDRLAESDVFSVIQIDHGQVIADPLGVADRIAAFLERRLDTRAMAACVNPDLYRQRGQV